MPTPRPESNPRTTSHRLRDLVRLTRRALARADALVVAAPLCLVAATGCSPTPPSNHVTDVEVQSGGATTGGEMVEVKTTSAGAGGGETKHDTCKVEPVKVGGCGGGEAKLLGTFAECGLKQDEDIDPKRCQEFCGDFPTNGCSAGERAGEAYVYCHALHPCLGRMPSRRLRASRRADSDVDAYLGHATRMEAVSVDAFVELEGTLARFGAPKSLGDACVRAAKDEARHALAMQAIRRARGGRVRASARPRRVGKGFASIEALAIHNEREGVVGETWGAMLAAFQSTRALAPETRRALATIAREELRHAALSARIGQWARARLDADARARVDRVRAETVARIARTTTGFPGRDGANELGWPTDAERAVLVEELAAFFA